MSNIIFVFTCYKEETPQGQLTEAIVVEVAAKNLAEAEERAKALTDRPEAKVTNVVELYAKGEQKPPFVCFLRGYYQQNGQQFVDEVRFELWGDGVAEIEARAKKLCERKFYQVNKVVEKLATEE